MLKRVAVILPCLHLEDLSRGLFGQAAAEVLSAWTAAWHPALIHATGELPAWHSASDPPDPAQVEGALFVVPPVSRERLPADWWERMSSTAPRNNPPVLATASREQTIAEILEAADLSEVRIDADVTGDFLALGFAHLQLELLTRAMRYTTVLDMDGFQRSVVEAARASSAGDNARARDELVAAFDLLTDARNHFYAVDFYLVDVTLLAESTLGAALRAKLGSGTPTNLLTTTQLIEQLALDDASLAAVKSAVNGGSACLVQGPRSGAALSSREPEGLLAEIQEGRAVCERLLNIQPTLFGQFGNEYSPLLPEILNSLAYRGVLYTTFDGSRLERPSQPLARWGAREASSIDALSTLPIDVADPGGWLAFGEYVGETLMRDHVATILLAGWPGRACEYYEDLQRIARHSPMFGKFVTLEDYYQSPDNSYHWAKFYREHYVPTTTHAIEDRPISSRVKAYRAQSAHVFEELARGLATVVTATDAAHETAEELHRVELNPWNTTSARFVDFDPIDFSAKPSDPADASYLADVPGMGFVAGQERSAALRAPLVEGHTLRNELIEVVVSESTGGIQSLRTHRDRRTRASQRLVMHDQRLPRETQSSILDGDAPRPSARMVAESVEISRVDDLVGEVVSRGQLVEAGGARLARFEQRMRVVRGLPIVIVNAHLEPHLLPEGDLWDSYFASRIAWREEAVTVRCGVDWTARETTRRRIESSEWVEIADAVGPVTCFALGLPYHRLASDTWLDTLLFTAEETSQQFQFAIGVDCQYPSQAALTLATAGLPAHVSLPVRPPATRGWFLHVSAKNALVTHLEMLAGAEGRGVRLRILETEGREASTSVSCFREFRAARRETFLGEIVESLPVANGKVELAIQPHSWTQIAAEW